MIQMIMLVEKDTTYHKLTFSMRLVRLIIMEATSLAKPDSKQE
jgi:hypothetical protein